MIFGRKVPTYLWCMSVTLALRCDNIKDVLNGWQSDQEHRPYCRGY